MGWSSARYTSHWSRFNNAIRESFIRREQVMNLKQPILFSIFLIISILFLPNVSAYTDNELSAIYHGDNNQMGSAIRNGTLKCSELPNDIISFDCPDYQAKLAAANAGNSTYNTPSS